MTVSAAALEQLEEDLTRALERLRELRLSDVPPKPVEAPLAKSGTSLSLISESSRRTAQELSAATAFEYMGEQKDLQDATKEAMTHLRGRASVMNTLPNALDDEMFEGRRCRVPLLHPASNGRFVLEIGGIMCFMIDVLFSPLQVFYMDIDSKFSRALAALSIISSVYWTINLPFGFLCSYFKVDGNLETSHYNVAKRYFCTWFFHDAALVTCDWVSVFSNSLGDSTSTVLRAFRFLRVLRAVRVNGVMQHLTERINLNSTLGLCYRVCKYFLTVILLVHLVACAWFAIGLNYSRSRFTWITFYEVEERSVHFKIFSSWHWAMAQFGPTKMTVTPTNTPERLYAICVATVAMIANPFLVSKITSSMVTLENLQREKRLENQQLHYYMHRQGISEALRSRVFNYTGMQAPPIGKAKEFLKGLPMDMAVELRSQILAPLMSKHAFLRVYIKRRLQDATLITMVSDGIEDRALCGSEKLFSIGEEARNMYFVKQGHIGYQLREATSSVTAASFGRVRTDTQTLLPSGDWLSEQALWLADWKHVGVAAGASDVTTAAEVLSLRSWVFQRLFGDDFVVKYYCRCYLEEIKRRPPTDVGDLEWTEDIVSCWLHGDFLDFTSEQQRRSLEELNPEKKILEMDLFSEASASASAAMPANPPSPPDMRNADFHQDQDKKGTASV